MERLSELSSGKIALAEEVGGAFSPLAEALKGGLSPKKLVVISPKRPAKQVLEIFSQIVGVPKAGVFIIDCVEKRALGEKQVAYVRSPKNTANITMALSSAFSAGERGAGPVLVYVDGIETFEKRLQKAKFDAFMYGLLMKIRLENSAGIVAFSPEDGKVANKELEALRYMCDGTFKA